MAITTVNGAYADPNTNLGKQLVKEVRGDTYLTKEYSDSTGESTFGLPEWIPDDNGNYKPYIIMENNDAYVIENKYLPMGINKSNCMTTFYLNNENILDGADTLIENQYWEVYHKENETDNYQLLDTSSWDCDTSFNTSSKQFSIFTTWDKSHGDIPLAQSQYNTTSTNSTGTFYFKTLSETTNNPTSSQQVITNSTGTFTVDVWTDNFTTTTENIPVIPDELISTFEVEYRYMLETGDVESFTRIINNDANMENHYFQFVNKFDGVNYNSFNLGDDIEFTDASYIGSYYATAENVPDKYIQIAEQGYPLYYSLEKGEKWWTGAGATIYMDGAEKKLNVQVDFGKDRTPLPLNTLQELDPTITLSSPTDLNSRNIVGGNGATSCAFDGTGTINSGNHQLYLSTTGNSGGGCMINPYLWDVSSMADGSAVTDVDWNITIGSVQGARSCDVYDFNTALAGVSTGSSLGDVWTDATSGNKYITNDSTCETSGSKTLSLSSQANTDLTNAITGTDLFGVSILYNTWVRDGSDHGLNTLSSSTLTVEYTAPVVTSAPTNLAGADASTSAINLSWTAPSDSGSSGIPAVSGYRIQSSDFAFANSSLPTGRTADSDSYGALTGDVDMVNANLYLSMNGTQNFGTDNGIGSSADGTNYGGTTGETGKLSNAWGFDGTNDWINLGTGLNSYIDGNPFTISAWAYVTATNISDRTVIGKQIAGYSSPYHVLNLRAYQGDWALTTNNNSSYLGCTNAIDSTGWTHLAVQFDGTSSFELFENGASACTFSASGTNWSSSYWSIGNGEGTTRYFNDKIDQVLFYNSDSVSISDLYNSGSGTSSPSTTNLIAHYDFDEGTRQGYGGGMSASNWGGGGGGGAGSAGSDSSGSGSGTNGANGGDGRSSDITGSAVIYSAGGGGGGGSGGSGGAGGSSGVGGAGTGSSGSAGNGATNTGSGGGSGRTNTGGGGDGADGVVILRFTTSGNTYSQTGGTVSTSGSDTIISWTATSGTTTFTPTSEFNVRYLIVAGGGGGFSGNTDAGQGGGGAGGMLEQSVHAVTAQTYTIVVGAGGGGGSGSQVAGVSGSDSSFDSITATGGGYGTGYGNQSINGGSGGGTGGSGNSWSYGETSSLTNKALESDIKMLDESYRGNHATTIPAQASTVFTDDFSSADWTDPSADDPNITGGVVNIDSINDLSYITYDLGSVSDTWNFRFKITPTNIVSSGGTGSQTFIGLVNWDGSTLSNGFPVVTGVGHETWHEGSINRTYLADPENSWYSWDHEVNANYGFSASTTYWIEIVRTGTYTFEMNYYDNADYTGTPIMELTHTSGHTNAGISHIMINNNDYVNNGVSGMTGTVDDLKFYDGVTEIPFDFSKDTDLNFEGTSSAVFNGSTSYMTLPSDNTIISTTGAFTLGTWIKPDRIVEITVNEGYSSGFTTVGSTVIIDSNHVKSQNSPTDADHRQHKALGTTLDNEKFLVKFDFDYDSNTSSTLPLALTSSTGNMHIASHDALGVFMDSGNLNIWYKDGSGSYTASGSTQAISSGTQYYLEFARTSSTTTTLKVFTDSSFTTQHGSTLTQTVPSTVQGLTTLQHGTWTSAGGASGQTWEIANTKIYDGITLVNDQTIFSYPSSSGSVDFNIEGDDLAFRSGDANNDPIIARTHGMNEGSWNNVAVSRDGSNNFEIFVNGTRVGAVASNSTAINAKTSGENYYIGASGTTSKLHYTFNDLNISNDGSGGSTYDGTNSSGTQLSSQITNLNDAIQWTGSNYAVGGGSASDYAFMFDGDLTVSWWMKHDGTPANGQAIAYTAPNGGSDDGWYLDPRSSNGIRIGWQHSNGGAGESKVFSNAISSGWHHYVITYEGSSGDIILYVDGSLDTSSTIGTTHVGLGSSSVDCPIYFTVRPTSGCGGVTQGTDISLDNFMMFESVLDLTDVQSLYNSGDGKEYHWIVDNNYLDGKMDEMYVLSTQSDTVIDNISSRGENSWTDLSYNTGGTGTTYSHTGISGGSGTYVAYRVSAHNSVGLSGFDLAEESTASTPSAPQNLSIASTSPTILTLDWDAPASQGGSSISAYKVYRGSSSGFTLDSGSLITTITDTSVTEYANTGLTADTRYYYSVLATNTQGDGTQADENAYTLLNAPTSLTATGASVSQINLAWTAPTGANNLDGYKIEYNNGSWQNLVADTGSTGTTYSHTSLSTGNSFTYRVSGLFGSLAGLTSNTAQGSTYAVPSAITDLSGVGLTGSSLRLSWSAPSSTPALTGYMIEQSDDNFSTSTTLTSNTGDTNTTYDVSSGVSENTDYYFRVKAINSIGTASASNIPTVQTGASQSGGGGGGGGGSTSFLPQFDELVSLSVFGNAHKLTLGESVQDTLRLEWNSAEDLQVNEIIVGDNPFRFAVQKPPFIVLGDNDKLSNAEISYTIQVPNNYCTMDITVQCVEPDFYELPVNIKVLSEGRTINKNVVITVDLSSGFDPALFVILLVAGIASFGMYTVATRGSKKKNGSVRKTVNSKPKSRKNGSVRKALDL